MDKAKEPTQSQAPVEKQQLTGLKKRQQIAQANKMIFLWTAAAAVAVSFCAVALQFLIREGLFNQKIISAKSHTNQTLEQNLKTADDLKANVQALLANSDLAAVNTHADNNSLQVVLDALPTEGDATSFATSLQNIILVQSHASVTALSTKSQFSGDGGTDSSDSGTSSSINTDALALPFTAQIGGNYQQIEGTLDDISRTIRPINITTLEIKGQDANLDVVLSGDTYYLPAATVKLGSEEITP
ncbi:MAG TPA: hypothetical protein VFK03_03255 [Candidatus Saccharimonadales bacterium]|nr:hypothetical protein [Candidatus Saccharimonadales bacterium]